MPRGIARGSAARCADATGRPDAHRPRPATRTGRGDGAWPVYASTRERARHTARGDARAQGRRLHVCAPYAPMATPRTYHPEARAMRRDRRGVAQRVPRATIVWRQGARGERGGLGRGWKRGGVAAGSEAGRTAPLCAAPRTHVPHAGLHCTWLRYVRWWRNGPPRCASAPPRHMNGPRLCGVVCVRHGARARATRHAWRMPGTRASTIRMCAMRAHGCATRPQSEAQAAWCDRHGGARRALRAATARGQRRTKSAVGCARQGQPTG